MPHYKTQNGIIRHFHNNVEHISTPSLLFIEALELAIHKFNDIDLSKIKAISGSGQQHGSVWFKKDCSLNIFNKMNQVEDSDGRLIDLFRDAFSLNLSPIWMDSSTSIECDEITQSKLIFRT